MNDQNWGVSSVYCRQEDLNVSYLCTSNNGRDAIGLYQWHFDSCKYCFTKHQQKAINVQDDRGWQFICIHRHELWIFVPCQILELLTVLTKMCVEEGQAFER